MDHSLPVTCSLSSPRIGTLTIRPVHQGTQGAVVKQKPPSRSSKDYSPVLSIQDKTPVLPCWHVGAHPLMPTSTHQLRCYIKGPSIPHYHKSLLYAGQTVSVLNENRTLWLLAKVIHRVTHGSYLVQVIGRGQCRCACDYICEYHLDAVKHDMPTTPVTVPATPEAVPALFAASHQQLQLHLLHPQHHNWLLLQQPQTLYANHLQYHSDCRCHPLEVHQSRLAQHLLLLLIHPCQEANFQAS